MTSKVRDQSRLALSNSSRHKAIHFTIDITTIKPFVNSVIRLFATEIDCRLLNNSKGLDDNVLIKLSLKLIEITLESPEILLKKDSFMSMAFYQCCVAYQLTLATNESTCC